MLTSKNVMEYEPLPGMSSSIHFLKNETFKDPFDPSNEQFAFDFIIKRVEEAMGRLKPRAYYADKLGELEKGINSLNDYHMMNVMRLHLDEFDILKGNLEYLTKTSKTNILSLYGTGGTN